MQLIIDIKNESIVEKIKTILNAFKDDGVKVQELNTKNQKPETELSDEYIAKNWRKIGMNTHSADLDDNEMKYDAYARFTHDKYSS